MNAKDGQKTFIRAVFLAYFALSAAASIGHDWLIDMRAESVNRGLHEQVMKGEAPAPIQYRIFQYYAAEGLIRIGVPFREAYFLLRWMFTFLAAAALHYFLSFWFAPAVCAAGTLYFFAGLPLVYYGYYMQPMDIPNLFFMLAGCILILKRQDAWLVPLTVVAMLNRETAILLVPVYLFARYDELKLPVLAVRAGAVFAGGMLVYVALRAIFTLKHYYADMYYLGSNLGDIRMYTHALALFGPLAFLSVWKFREKPRFIRRAMLMLPFFAVIHVTMTIMREPRLWLPVFPFVLAAALWAVVPEEYKKEQPAAPSKPGSFVARHPEAAYFALFFMFLASFTGFFYYYKNAHMADRDRKLRAEKLITEARAYAAAQMPQRAVEELNKAAVIDPSGSAPHYELAVIYENLLFDRAKALFHFKETLRLEPYHLNRQRIEKEIEWLEYNLKK